MKTLLMDVRHHDALQTVHDLMELLSAVRSWHPAAKILSRKVSRCNAFKLQTEAHLTEGVVEMKVELLGEEEE